jgi:AhpD family alkylhydroperoxidase
MFRLAVPARDDSHSRSIPLLDAVGTQLGFIANKLRLIGNSPAGLEADLGFSHTMNKTLDGKMRERIAVAVAQVNGCDDCLSAHSYLGSNMARLDAAELAASRSGHSNDMKADPAIGFAKKVAETRGEVTDTDIETVKTAGYTDSQIVEIVLCVALNFLTNLVNKFGETEIDFPELYASAA